MAATGPRPSATTARTTAGSGSLVAGRVFVLDQVRIEVALEARQRYKYVQPSVVCEGAGWRVDSPNCSRNVRPDGGLIPIAWLQPQGADAGHSVGPWWLHAWDHAQGGWVLKLRAASLDDALARLANDPLHEFWV